GRLSHARGRQRTDQPAADPREVSSRGQNAADHRGEAGGGRLSAGAEVEVTSVPPPVTLRNRVPNRVFSHVSRPRSPRRDAVGLRRTTISEPARHATIIPPPAPKTLPDPRDSSLLKTPPATYNSVRLSAVDRRARLDSFRRTKLQQHQRFR